MTILKHNLESHIRGFCCISIKDLSKNLDVANSKWDFLFNYILEISGGYYFLGNRLDCFDKSVNNLISEVAEAVIFDENNSREILIKIKAANLGINRRRLAELWSLYEYPAVIFLENSGQEQYLIQLCGTSSSTYEEMATSLKGTFILHKGIEQDVLWIQKC